MTDNANNINLNWRPSTGGGSISNTLGMAGGSASVAASAVPSVESVLSMQKRGAERLFQYMEADGSDPEDYSR